MRRAWLILLGAALPVTAQAQDQPPPTGIASRDFSISDSPCKYEHDGSVEKSMQMVRVVVDSAKPTRAATLELRNNSAKSITAYVFNYASTHGGKTDYYGGRGADLVYEMAIAKSSQQALPNSAFPPGGVVEQEINAGREHGQFEVYPCMVAFDDGTFIGPPSMVQLLMQMRADSAKALGGLVADLKSARDSSNPKTFLTNRAQQVKRTSKGRSGEELYRYLEIVASGLSSSGNTPLDRKTITAHVSALQAQQEMLVKQSTFRKTE
jgi:hypothetical protein